MAYKGKYTVKNPEKYVGDPNKITYRSLWERQFMQRCDMDKRILQWKSEGFAILYRSPVDNKTHRYFIDFFIQIVNGDGEVEKLAIEIKPFSQTQPPQKTGNKSKMKLLSEIKTYEVNKAKWTAANQWAIVNGFKFLILTENELNVR